MERSQVAKLHVVRDPDIQSDTTVDNGPVEFDDLYRREYSSLRRTAFAICGSRSIAEEVVHDAFLTAHRKWDEVGSLDRPGAWLRRCVVNRSISQVRRVRYEARALLRLGNRPTTSESRDRYLDGDQELWQAVRKLPKKQAQAIVLRYVNDLDCDRIAEIMECEPGTARTHLSRARKSLAGTLGEIAPDDEVASSDEQRATVIPFETKENGASA